MYLTMLLIKGVAKLALELDISRVRSVKGSEEHYHLETAVFDFMDEDWQSRW